LTASSLAKGRVAAISTGGGPASILGGVLPLGDAACVVGGGSGIRSAGKIGGSDLATIFAGPLALLLVAGGTADAGGGFSASSLIGLVSVRADGCGAETVSDGCNGASVVTGGVVVDDPDLKKTQPAAESPATSATADTDKNHL
jgi:hypothetical protein